MAILRNHKQLSLPEQLAQIRTMRELTPQVYRQLTTLLLSSQPIPPDNRQQLIIILDEVKLGLIRITPN
jgi:hypothetical protein